MRRLLRALPPGSFLAATRLASDLLPGAVDIGELSDRLGARLHARSRAEFAELFDGLTLAEPGIVPVSEWRSNPPADDGQGPLDAPMWAAVGRIPAY